MSSGTPVVSITALRSAKAASLQYVTDATPGILRVRSGRGFTYRSPAGGIVRDHTTLNRIRALVIPPAWTRVWICTRADGHLQATGRDARGRKQYRYHTRWRAVRDETKYAKMAAFARALPRIRRRVQADLALPGVPRDKVLAVIVRLLETTFMRVGNEEYARENGSFGLTTLRDRHAQVSGTKVTLKFRGKSGKEHAVDVGDKRLAAMVKRCRDLPGQSLFQYVDDDGNAQPVQSSDVNAYLHDVAGDEFTAKDFRTWAGTLLAAAELAHFDGENAPTKSEVVAAVATVAKALGNTPAICRKCYVHPSVLAAFNDTRARAGWARALARAEGKRGLRKEEVALVAFLTSAIRKAA